MILKYWLQRFRPYGNFPNASLFAPYMLYLVLVELLHVIKIALLVQKVLSLFFEIPVAIRGWRVRPIRLDLVIIALVWRNHHIFNQWLTSALLVQFLSWAQTWKAGMYFVKGSLDIVLFLDSQQSLLSLYLFESLELWFQVTLDIVLFHWDLVVNILCESWRPDQLWLVHQFVLLVVQWIWRVQKTAIELAIVSLRI